MNGKLPASWGGMWWRLPSKLSDGGGGHGALTSSDDARADDGVAAGACAETILSAGIVASESILANINDETWRQMARLWRKPEPSYLPE